MKSVNTMPRCYLLKKKAAALELRRAAEEEQKRRSALSNNNNDDEQEQFDLRATTFCNNVHRGKLFTFKLNLWNGDTLSNITFIVVGKLFETIENTVDGK